MGQKIKAPNSKSGSGFLWGIIAIIAIAATVIGVIVVKNSDDKVSSGINADIAINGDAIQLRSSNAAKDAKVVDLYEDYSCHYCAQLDKESGTQLRDAIESGKIVLNIRNLTFLNKEVNDSSLRSASAALAAAKSGDSSLYWKMRTYLFDNQPSIVGKWDIPQYQTELKDLGASAGTVNSVASKEGREGAERMASRNAETLKEKIGEVSSPHVFVDGKQLIFGKDAEFDNWVEVALK